VGCHGRQEVLDTFGAGLEQRREIDALEFTLGGEQVVLGARAPSMTEVGGEPLGGQIFNVFTLRDGRIVRIARAGFDVEFYERRFQPGRTEPKSRRSHSRTPGVVIG